MRIQDLGMGLSQIKIPKISEILAQQILDKIISGEVTEGAILPPERKLSEQLGLSRATVREALRMLEMEGVITFKRGAKGGAVVREPRPEGVTRSLALVMEFEKTNLSSLVEARELVEPMCAKLAALRRTERDLSLLRKSVQRMGDALSEQSKFFYENSTFHMTIANAACNPVFKTVVVALRELVYHYTTKVDPDLGDRQAILKAHAEVVDALADKDPDRAEVAMRFHMSAWKSRFKNYYGNLDDISIGPGGLRSNLYPLTPNLSYTEGGITFKD